MANYTIIIVNHKCNDTAFMLFVDNEIKNTSQQCTNVFYQTQFLGSSTGRYDINIPWGRNSAVCGTANSPLGDGVSVSGCQTTNLQLFNTKPYAVQVGPSTIPGDDAFVFTNGDYAAMSGLESGQIGTQVAPYDQSLYENTFVGFGMLLPNSMGFAGPAITISASANQPFFFEPSPKFFIVAGSKGRGTIQSKPGVGSYAEVDFTAFPGKTYAIVTYNDYGEYDPVTYSSHYSAVPPPST